MMKRILLQLMKRMGSPWDRYGAWDEVNMPHNLVLLMLVPALNVPDINVVHP